jgi:hypothetical protein
MTTGPDDLDDLAVLKELGQADELDDLDQDEGEDLLDHPEDEVALDARSPRLHDSVLAQDEVLDLWSDDEDALGTETGGFGPDRPRDAAMPGLYESGEIDDAKGDGDVYDDDLTGPDPQDGPG